MLRACSSLESTLEMAREGRPFLMNVQTNAVTQQRMDAYRQTMAASAMTTRRLRRQRNSAGLGEMCW